MERKEVWRPSSRQHKATGLALVLEASCESESEVELLCSKFTSLGSKQSQATKLK
jgi:hypothetical protein